MSDWKPKPKPDAKTEDMNLTGEEGFVLSRIDGSTSVKSLADVTGLPEGRVRQIMQKLVRQGAVEDGASSAQPAPEPAAKAQKPAAAPRPAPAPVETAVDELSPAQLRELMTMDDDIDATASAEPATQPSISVPAGVALPPGVQGVEEAQIDEAPDELDKASTSGAGDDAAADEAASGGEAGDDAAEKTDDAAAEAEEANYRKLYNTELSKLDAPVREALAKSCTETQLMALCFDPLHNVIKAVFDNAKAGFQHARLVARNHHTPQGLDVIIHRAELFRDAQVQRLLLQNTMLQEPQLKKILQPKRLADVYKVAISREIPERNRQKARHVMRSKWATGEAEERAGLVFTTEGRCLLQLTGLPFDSHTTTLLCQKTYNSVLLIQNLARFGSTPPQVLAHLMRQASVKRQQHLRTLIKQHPNCPADAKRQA